MSTNDISPFICQHGIDRRREKCLLCDPWQGTWTVPYYSPTEHCGKCGAPFTRDAAGNPLPICACWNIRQSTTTTNVTLEGAE